MKDLAFCFTLQPLGVSLLHCQLISCNVFVEKKRRTALCIVCTAQLESNSHTQPIKILDQ